jgi:hypothetical protein
MNEQAGYSVSMKKKLIIVAFRWGDQQGVGAGEVSFTTTSISSYNWKILLY